MTNWIDLINYSFAVCGLFAAVMGLFQSRSVPYLEPGSRRFFSGIFPLIIAYIISDIVSQISLTFLGERFSMLSRIAVFSESMLSSLLMPLMTWYLFYLIGETRGEKTVKRIVAALWLVYMGLLIATQFTTDIYWISPENTYGRGPLYPVLLVSPIALMMVNLAILFINRKRLSRRQRQAFSAYLIIPLCCMLVQTVSYGLLMIVIGTSAGAMLMLLFIMRDQMEKHIRQEEENIRQRSNIMVLQMRPHFIYNTMTSIYYLCKQDPDKAQQVIMDFTSYLRRNFTAIAREEAVPFTEEMEHTRAYLAVEQVRFEGKLSVSFDIPHTTFRIPPLTLQPVVENAVKHGVDPDMEPLFISVRTRKTERGNEIVIEDTGPGYGASGHDGSHIALDNIRERLRIMCGGTLDISPRDGGGTIVTITV